MPCGFFTILGFMLLGTCVAHAEQNYIHFSSDAKSTLILCASILAGGMVGAAALMRRPK